MYEDRIGCLDRVQSLDQTFCCFFKEQQQKHTHAYKNYTPNQLSLAQKNPPTLEKTQAALLKYTCPTRKQDKVLHSHLG